MGTKERASARGSFTTNMSRTASFESERDFWNSIKDGNDIAELQEFLVQFPDSVFANLARIRIGKSYGITDTGIRAMGMQNLEQTRSMQEAASLPPNLVAPELAKERPTAVLARPFVEVLDPSLRPIVSEAETKSLIQEPAKPKKSRTPLLLAGAAVALTAAGAVAYMSNNARLPTPTPPAPIVSTVKPPAPMVSTATPPTQVPEVAQKPATPKIEEAKAPKVVQTKRIVRGVATTRTQSTWASESDAVPVAPMPRKYIGSKWRESPVEERRSDIMAERRPFSHRHVEQNPYPERGRHGRETMHRSYRDRY
jgi:hypothetical protein